MRNSFENVIPHASREVDACLYMFGLCKQLQMTCLARRRIDCLVDTEGAGRLPETVCRMLGLMVCELVEDVSERTPRELAPRAITVMLRRRGAVCLCTISGEGSVDSYADAKVGLRRVRHLAAELDGTCMVRSMPERGTIAIMFDVRSVEPRLPAAIRRYRVDVARRPIVGHVPAALE
jgi:hypothetical protein